MILFSEHASDSKNFDQMRVSTLLYKQKTRLLKAHRMVLKGKTNVAKYRTGQRKAINCF